MIPNHSQLADHARQLGVAFKIRIIETAVILPDEASALYDMRAILIGPIVDDTTYAVALHEMGHLESALGTARVSAGKLNKAILLIEEKAAWDWARHYALDWTPAMDALRTWAMSTYEEIPETRPTRQEPVAPPVITTQSIDWSTYTRRS